MTKFGKTATIAGFFLVAASSFLWSAGSKLAVGVASNEGAKVLVDKFSGKAAQEAADKCVQKKMDAAMTDKLQTLETYTMTKEDILPLSDACEKETGTKPSTVYSDKDITFNFTVTKP